METSRLDEQQTDATPYGRSAEDVAAAAGTDLDRGLSAAEAASRLASIGPNEIASEPPPSVIAVALGQLRDPMNLMLVAVTIVSFAIGEVSTGVIVALADRAQPRARRRARS